MALEKHFCSLQPQGLGCSNGREKILILLGMILPTASFTFFYFTGAMFTTSLWVRERGNLDCGLTPACVRGGPRPAPPTTTLPWWGPGRPEEATSWSRQSSAGPLTEIFMPGCSQSSIRDKSDENMHNVKSNYGCVVYIVHRNTGCCLI